MFWTPIELWRLSLWQECVLKSYTEVQSFLWLSQHRRNKVTGIQSTLSSRENKVTGIQSTLSSRENYGD